MKPHVKKLIGLAVAAVVMFFMLSSKHIQGFKSQASYAFSEQAVPPIKNGVFKGRLVQGKTRQIGGRAYQCWQDERANASGDLSLLTSRYLPTDAILQKIEATQYACGKTNFKNVEELTAMKKKFKEIVRSERPTSELNFCEASTLHFLIRDTARKSAFSTAPCPI